MWCFCFWGGGGVTFAQPWGANIECPFILSRFDWMEALYRRFSLSAS